MSIIPRKHEDEYVSFGYKIKKTWLEWLGRRFFVKESIIGRRRIS